MPTQGSCVKPYTRCPIDYGSSELFANCERCSFGPVLRSELAEQVGHVRFDRSGADEQRFGDFPVGFALGEEAKNVEFTRC